MVRASLDDALAFPFSDDEWVITMLIGGVLTFFSWLLLPAFILQGYFLKVARQAAAGEDGHPSFENYGKLLVDGLKAMVIMLVYQLIPLVVFIAVFVSSFAAIGMENEALGGVGVVTMLLGILVYMVLATVFGYIGTAGIMNFAVTGKMGAAFDVETLKTVALSKEWVVAWLFVFVVQLIVNVVFGVIGLIPLIGLLLLLLLPFVMVYVGMVTFRLYGHGFDAAKNGA